MQVYECEVIALLKDKTWEEVITVVFESAVIGPNSYPIGAKRMDKLRSYALELVEFDKVELPPDTIGLFVRLKE